MGLAGGDSVGQDYSVEADGAVVDRDGYDAVVFTVALELSHETVASVDESAELTLQCAHVVEVHRYAGAVALQLPGEIAVLSDAAVLVHAHRLPDDTADGAYPRVAREIVHRDVQQVVGC